MESRDSSGTAENVASSKFMTSTWYNEPSAQSFRRPLAYLGWALMYKGEQPPPRNGKIPVISIWTQREF